MDKHIFRKEVLKVFNSKQTIEEKDKALLKIIKNYENDPFILNTQYPKYDSKKYETLLLHVLDHELYNSAISLIKNKHVNINVSMGNMSSLMFAAVRNEDFVKALLERPDLDSQYESFNINALLFAIEYSSAKVVKMLLDSPHSFEFKLEKKGLLHLAYYNQNQLDRYLPDDRIMENKLEMIEILMPYEKNPLKQYDGENVLECLFRSPFDINIDLFLPKQIQIIQKMIDFYNFDLKTIETAYNNTARDELPCCDEFIQAYMKSLKEKESLENTLLNDDKIEAKKLKL
jgi:hypothetical protein